VSQDESNQPRRLVTRRAAIQLGAGAGAAALAAPYLARAGGDAFDLGDALPVLAQNPGWPVPSMITRAGWGANESLRKPGLVYDTSIAKIIVHHTGTPNDITDYAGLARSILAQETAGEYLDIAYNWLIDPNGNLYEGRWAQDYPPGVPHTGEALGANVRGAHAIYHNSFTVGVALMGNYEIADPSPAMIDTLVNFLAWKCSRWGLDPRESGIYNASNGAVENLFNICGHRDTSATACPGIRVESMLPTLRQRVAGRMFGGGYWIASSTGDVRSFGGASSSGDAHGTRVVGIAGHGTGDGYWLCAPDGGVFSFGAAHYHGGMYGRGLAAPIVGMAAMPSGNGYWLVAGDGGIFSFGDAQFHGSTGGMRLDQPVVSMARSPSGGGYWLVAADGGVFAFGNVGFYGSASSYPSFSPCVGMLPTTTGRGYVLLRADGSVWAFGDAVYLGGANGMLTSSAVGIAGRLKPL